MANKLRGWHSPSIHDDTIIMPDDDVDGCEQLLVGSPGSGGVAAAAELPATSHADIDQQYHTSRARNVSK